MLQFQHIEYLFALSAIPLMIILYVPLIRWKKNTVKKIGDEALVKQLIREYSPTKFFLKFIITITAFTAAVIGLANPRLPLGSTNVNRSGIDVMIALDVSKSMLAQDVKPDRLERAKQFITKLIDKLADDRVGIVIFAGRAYLQMPLTTDHSAAKMYLSSATPDVVPTQGTVIGDALKTCYAAFNTKEKKYKAVILISDGEDHDETAIKITKELADEGVIINTIGIGSPEGTTIMDPANNEYKKDAAGSLVITKLNEVELRNIAEYGNGLYQRFINTDELITNLDARLKGIGQKSIIDTSLLNYQNFFPWLLSFALFLLLIEFFIPEIKSTTKESTTQPLTAKSQQLMATIALFLFFPCGMFGQNDNTLVKKGNEAYIKKQYDAAAENYKAAATKNPVNEKAQYNLGNALYKAGKKEEAIHAYEAIIQNNKFLPDKEISWYNKGVVLQNNKQLPECIEAYKNSLRLNPADEDARLNLQKALLQQKQQQQQKKEQEKKQPKEDQKQKEKQKPDKDKNDQPKQQPSKMTRQEAEEKLNALLQKEKNLQDKLRKVDAASPNKPEKDW